VNATRAGFLGDLRALQDAGRLKPLPKTAKAPKARKQN
jgi:hypothetical protein